MREYKKEQGIVIATDTAEFTRMKQIKLLTKKVDELSEQVAYLTQIIVERGLDGNSNK